MKTFTPIILILISIGLFFFVIDPEYKKVQELQAEVEENNKTLDIAAKLSKRHEELKKKFNQIAPDDRAKLEKLLPDSVDNVRLLIDIDNIAENLTLTIRNINITSDDSENTRAASARSQGSTFEDIIDDDAIRYADTSKLGVISFSFSVSAKYEVFLEFIRQLEESLRIVDIRNIEISRGSAEGSIYDYKVTMDTYWLK